MSQHIFISGGSSGLGLRITEDLLQQKNQVTATYISHPHALHSLERENKNLTTLQLDLEHPEIPIIKSLDSLILNAGVIMQGLVSQTSSSQFSKGLQLNVGSQAKIVQQLLPSLKDSPNPHIIFIGSFSGFHGHPGQSTYSASKSALVGLSKSLAIEFSEHHIKVNTIYPGFMESRQTEVLSKELKQHYINQNLLKRSNSLEELSSFIRHLLTTENISGQVFNLDSRISGMG